MEIDLRRLLPPPAKSPDRHMRESRSPSRTDPFPHGPPPRPTAGYSPDRGGGETSDLIALSGGVLGRCRPPPLSEPAAGRAAGRGFRSAAAAGPAGKPPP